MKVVVLDCSVAVPWFFPEEESGYAEGVLTDARERLISFEAPDLLMTEFANVAWKKVRGRMCSMAHASAQLSRFMGLGVVYSAPQPFLAAALELASGAAITVYDSMYLTLAMTRNSALATDDKLLRSKAQEVGVECYAPAQ